MRERFRKTVIRELIILALFAAIGAGLIFQANVVEERLKVAPVIWMGGAPLEQNLSALGLTHKEINAITMMEDFKRDYPQYSEASYHDTVGFYLSEFPGYKMGDALYVRIDAGEAKIKTAKAKLAEQRRLERMSQKLRRAGFIILIMYPITFGARFYLRHRRSKAHKVR